MKLKTKDALFLSIILAAIALFLGFSAQRYFNPQKKINISNFHGTYLEHPRPVNSFELTGINKEMFANKNLQGQWTIVFFGFTHCGYLCPTTMAELAKMYRTLERKKVKKLPKIVMISIDPKRDDVEKLGHYVTSFHPSFYGALGTEKAIKAMTREMGIAYAVFHNANNKDPENYDIQHSGALMLFNPHGELTAFFTTPHRANSLVKDYLMLSA